MKYLFPIVLLSFLGVCSNSQSIKTQKTEIPVNGYELIWRDEFNRSKLSDSWKYRGTGKRGDAYFSPNAIQLDGNGHLVISAYRNADSVFTGIIDTEQKFETRYGYFECRASLINNPGIWIGFWLQSSRNIDYSDPEHQGLEVDIFEYAPHNKKYEVAHALHWGGYGPSHKMVGPVYSHIENPEKFHVFGLEWTPDGYSVFVDGIKTQSADTLVSKVKQFLVLSMEVDEKIAGPLDPNSLPDHFIVDYVRVYKKK